MLVAVHVFPHRRTAGVDTTTLVAGTPYTPGGSVTASLPTSEAISVDAPTFWAAVKDAAHVLRVPGAAGGPAGATDTAAAPVVHDDAASSTASAPSDPSGAVVPTAAAAAPATGHRHRVSGWARFDEVYIQPLLIVSQQPASPPQTQPQST